MSQTTERRIAITPPLMSSELRFENSVNMETLNLSLSDTGPTGMLAQLAMPFTLACNSSSF